MIKMNIYISKSHKDIFIEKLKEIPIIDDYILDRERLGKEKIKVLTNTNTSDVITELADILPVDSMIVDQVDYPGKEYILCVGEISFSDFSYLKEKNINFSIVTKKQETFRFNAWIHFSQLEDIFQSGKVFHFSSINGQIKEETFFVIEVHANEIDDMHKSITAFSDAFIIKDNKIYVKLLMQQFTKVFEQIKDKYTKIEIIDDRVF